MRQAEIRFNGMRAGLLVEHGQMDYEFVYDPDYLRNPSRPAVSLTLPKQPQSHRADHLFSVFFSLLSEGVNKQLQCRLLRIDERDAFGLLLATAATDTVGALTVHKLPEHE